jgi:hypothetical protein
MMSVKPYPEGVDCVWLASDQAGHVGAFITAGMGPLPETALDASHIPVEDVEGRLCQLPVVSKAQLLVSVKRPDDFLDLAERGVFVYDWTDIHRAAHDALQVYEPVAVPLTPVTVDSLPSDLAVLAEAVQLAKVVFSSNVPLDVRAHVKCVEAA